jgi:hypothetical protein
MPKGRRESQARINESDLNWVKETLGRLLIENGTLRIVTAHLVAAKCKESNDPQLALRDLHRALDEAAQLVIQGDKPQAIQRLLEMYQPKIDEIIQAAGKLLSPPPQQS